MAPLSIILGIVNDGFRAFRELIIVGTLNCARRERVFYGIFEFLYSADVLIIENPFLDI